MGKLNMKTKIVRRLLELKFPGQKTVDIPAEEMSRLEMTAELILTDME